MAETEYVSSEQVERSYQRLQRITIACYAAGIVTITLNLGLLWWQYGLFAAFAAMVTSAVAITTDRVWRAQSRLDKSWDSSEATIKRLREVLAELEQELVRHSAKH